MTKGGPFVAAAIQWVHTTFEPEEPSNKMLGTRSPFLAAFLDGNPVSLDEVWHRKGDPITKAEYDYMVANAAWAKEHAPHEAIATPRKQLDLRLLPPIYQRKS